MTEETQCRYGGTNSKEKWPILHNKYLILSLLGKGGYSEVYKVNSMLK
jgi:predicted nucleic-acid-binding Zn-ribbon protein